MITISSISAGVVGFGVGAAFTWILNSPVILVLHRFKNVNNLVNVKMVLLVRGDLKMSTGKVAAQCAHAAVSCYAAAKRYSPAELSAWQLNGQPKIVLRLNKPGETELMKLYNEAKKLNVISAVVRDAGRTQLSPGTATVLAIGPADSHLVDSISGHFKLY